MTDAREEDSFDPRLSKNFTPSHHEPHWNLGRCSCGAPLGDSIDYTWHLSNQSYIAGWQAAQQSETRITDEMVERAAIVLHGSPSEWAWLAAKHPSKAYSWRSQARAALVAALEGPR